LWAAGIDTEEWRPSPVSQEERRRVLIYDKIRWNRDTLVPGLLQPIIDELAVRGLLYDVIRYGEYSPEEYKAKLEHSWAMVFMCEHESEGFACLEALSSNVPVFAWDCGEFLDPHRFAWGDPHIPATSVPFFDQRCGDTFSDLRSFREKLDDFLIRRPRCLPRQYILENLTLEQSAQRFLDILQDARRQSF
jgi:glycosyltransferase involved in cell wall biosynthesis